MEINVNVLLPTMQYPEYIVYVWLYLVVYRSICSRQSILQAHDTRDIRGGCYRLTDDDRISRRHHTAGVQHCVEK